MSEQLLNIDRVAAKVGMSVSWVFDQVKFAGFPRPLKLGAASRWRESEVDAWIEERARARDLAAAS